MMIISSFRIAIRHLSKQKVNTLLHVIGLTLGMSVCLLIGLFVRYELSFDTQHPHTANTYRINSVWTDSGKKNYHFSTPMPLADAIQGNLSGIGTVALTHPHSNVLIEINPAKRFLQSNILVATPALADMFHLETLQGNVKETLKRPYEGVITESAAKKFFGNDDPIGKSFTYKNEFQITVTSLIRDLPGNTHLPATLLLSFVPNEKFLGGGVDAWTYVSGTSTFVRVSENFNLNNLQQFLDDVADKHINSNQGLPKNMRAGFDIQPLRAIHFQPEYGGGGHWVKAVNTTWLWFFAAIGSAVLVLACINFVNLSTAQALTRAREVGVRKAVGAGKLQLLFQFITEAWLLAFTAGVLSLVIAYALVPAINTLLEKQMAFDILESPEMIFWLLISILSVGLLAGLYPAWIITRFNPVTTLKTNVSLSGTYRSSLVRKGLMTMQFAISAGLLIALILISEQVNFLRNKNLGFDKENILTISVQSSKASVFANELARIPQVKDFSFATGTPSSEGHWGSIMSLTNADDPNRKNVTLLLADDQFCPMYGLKLLSGRFLELSDTNYTARSVPEKDRVLRAVVNETLVKTLGFESNDAAVGKRFWIGMNSENTEIVGVVSDFNTGPLHHAVQPTLITQLPEVYGQVGVKIHADSDIQQTIAALESSWEKVFPDGIFEFKFLDDEIDSFYKSESRLHQLFRIFSALAMLISCLGLWGLSAFSAQQRTKEIGIRKVLGASVKAILVLLSRDFLIMVVIALVVSSPVAYFIMKDWLQDFAYRIDIGWHVFALAGVSSVLVAMLTVSFQAFRSALANPAESLRTE